jgi:hypothetical protein
MPSQSLGALVIGRHPFQVCPPSEDRARAYLEISLPAKE